MPRSRTWRRCPTRPLGHLLIAFALGGSSSCGSVAAPAPSLAERFDFSEPALRVTLAGSLDEVSGLAFTPTGQLLAHDDERARVYRLDPATGAVLEHFDLGDPVVEGDFEGIAAVADRVYLVTSGGSLYETWLPEHGAVADFTQTDLNLPGGCEIEGLATADDGNLLVSCKTTDEDDHGGIVWKVDPGRSEPISSIRLSRVGLEARGLPGVLHPSGVEQDPATGNLLILASGEGLLVEVASDGTVLSAVELAHALHRQPEGIALSPGGAMYIADESSGRKATLTRYDLSGPPTH